MVRHRRRDVDAAVRPVPGGRRGAGPGPRRGLTPADRSGRRRYHARVLRFLTAGESHGQALVVIVEGLPAGLPITVEEVQARAGPPPARLRPRAPHAVRAGRGHAARRRPPRPHARLAGGHRDRQQRVGRSPTSGTRRCRPRPARTEQPAHPAAARPRRPRRHAEVRLRRRPRRARAGQRPRDRGPGRGRLRWPRRCWPSSASTS